MMMMIILDVAVKGEDVRLNVDTFNRMLGAHTVSQVYAAEPTCEGNVVGLRELCGNSSVILLAFRHEFHFVH